LNDEPVNDEPVSMICECAHYGTLGIFHQYNLGQFGWLQSSSAMLRALLKTNSAQFREMVYSRAIMAALSYYT
jgi:hypothetical protein